MKGHFKLWITLTLIASGLSITGYFWFRQTTSSTGDSIIFEQPEKVNSIVITGKIDSLHILRIGENWCYEDGEILNQDAVENILTALSRLHIQSVYLPEEIDMMTSSTFTLKRKNKPIHLVRVLSLKERVFMAGEEPGEIYSVELPGYDLATLSKIFSNHRDHYREHLLLSLLPREIRELRIQPFNQMGFRVVQDSAQEVWVSETVDGSNLTELISIHEIRMLLSYFNVIRYEYRINETEVPAGMDIESPDASFMVRQRDNSADHFKVWKWTQNDTGEPDLFHALVKINDSEGYMVVNYKYLDLILRPLERYLQ